MKNQSALLNMIKQQLRTGDVLQESILALYHEITRDGFVPPSLQHFAYSDLQIELPHGQRMMTPLEEALILQALDLRGHETLLEVGTGTGFFTALLSRRCKKVVSIDYFESFSKNAQKNIMPYAISNIEFITGDASQGWLDKAPYDVIIFTGSLESLNETHRLQLIPGGKLFAIVGKEHIMQGQLHSLNHNNQWHSQLLFETNLPPLIDKSKPNEFVF